jgi:hypothetical protein
MKIKKNCFSTMISDLYGIDKYKSYIKVGNEYWHYFLGNTEEYEATHKYWNKIRITYIRSGCLFYILPDAPEVKEGFCPIDCFMTSRFVLAELDPVKDLKDLLHNIDTEAAKLKYCFNDEHTIIKNWSNEKEIEIDEDELYTKFGDSVDFIMIKMLETE